MLCTSHVLTWHQGKKTERWRPVHWTQPAATAERSNSFTKVSRRPTARAEGMLLSCLCGGTLAVSAAGCHVAAFGGTKQSYPYNVRGINALATPSFVAAACRMCSIASRFWVPVVLRKQVELCSRSFNDVPGVQTCNSGHTTTPVGFVTDCPGGSQD